MLSDYLTGLAYPFRGLSLLRRKGIRPMVVLPLLLNAVLFAGAIVVTAFYLDTALDALLPDWLDWLRWLLWPLFVVAVLTLVFLTFTLLANLVGAPFNGPLAARVEAHLSRGPVPDSGLSWQREAVTAVVNELRKLVYVIVRGFPLLLLFVIPGLQFLAPLAWLAFGAWMLALEYADAPMGNHGLGFREARERMGRQLPLALGFGSGMLVLTLVPVLNFVAMPAGVAGATAMWVERLGNGIRPRARP
jgi:CysZ protein